jgi:hypothetical protein
MISSGQPGRNFLPGGGVYSPMKWVYAILVLALAAGGCTTRSKARAQAQAGAAQAYLAGQNQVLQEAMEMQYAGVTILGPVQTSQVPWVEGLTLAQAIATANYLNPNPPSQIILNRQGDSATLDANVLLNGAVVPLEQGDVIELRP